VFKHYCGQRLVASFCRRTNGLVPLARRDAKAGKTNAKPQNVSCNYMDTALKIQIKHLRTILNIKNRIETKLPNLERQFGLNDVRCMLISRPSNSIVLQILIYKANEHTFHNNNWWAHIQVPVEGRQIFAEKYNTFTKYLGFIQFFSYVESEMRNLIRLYQPAACNNGKASFESVYTKILTELNCTDYIETFKFASIMRNAMHNNGCYLPTSHTKDKEIEFRSTKYLLQYGKEINFASLDLISDIQEDIFTCLFKIVDHPSIVGMK
jgi:hypothetical protein